MKIINFSMYHRIKKDYRAVDNYDLERGHLTKNNKA